MEVGVDTINEACHDYTCRKMRWDEVLEYGNKTHEIYSYSSSSMLNTIFAANA
jgi:hypothetical protein